MAWEFLKKISRLPMQKFRIVMGNESCDLDSAASAIAYAYIQSRMVEINHENVIVLPLLNIPVEDFVLKTEVRYYLKKCGVPLENLVFKNTIKLDALKPSRSLEVVLVDHHALSGQDISLKEYVTEVIDHRPLDPNWKWHNVKKTLEIVGSCATLVAEIAISQDDFPLPQEVLMLLYGTIILDTSCLSEAPKKFTSKDVEILDELEKRLEHKPKREDLYIELLSARCDILGLTVSQLLRKDMKIVSHIPISSLPLLAQDLLSMPDAAKEIDTFAGTYQHHAVIMLGISKFGDELKREIAIFAREEKLLQMLADTLVKSTDPDLQLKSLQKSENRNIILFDQVNIYASRKQIVPLVQEAIAKYERTFASSSRVFTDEED